MERCFARRYTVTNRPWPKLGFGFGRASVRADSVGHGPRFGGAMIGLERLTAEELTKLIALRAS